MKTLVIILVVFIINTLSAQTNSSKTDELIKKNALKKMIEREIDKTLNQLTYPGIDPLIFSTAQRRQLAAGEIVEKKSCSYSIPTKILPIITLNDVSVTESYKNISGQVKKVESKLEFGSSKTTWIISLISFYLPIFLIFSIPIFSGFNQNKLIKTRTTLFVVISNLFLFISILGGIIASSFTINGLMFGLPIIAAMIVTMIGNRTSAEKMLVFSGIITGTFAGVYTGRLSLLGFTVLSHELFIIWTYVTIYALAGTIAVIAMWLTKTDTEIIIDIEDDEE